MMPQHLLVPLDFSEPSEQAFAYALELAGKLQARLTLLHVIQTPMLAAGPGMEMGPAYADLMTQIEADVSQNLEAYAERGRQAGLRCETVLMHGVPYQQVLDLARDQQVDLIVMGTHGRTGLKHVMLGSVAEKVVRLAPCPVLVTRSAETEGEA